MWWDILKNAKIRGKGKTGGKLDTSRLKVNVEDNSCERDFNAWYSEQKHEHETNPKEFDFPSLLIKHKYSLNDKRKATEKEYCELLDYLKEGFADVLVSGLVMAIDHELKGYGDSHYQYTPFESSKGNIKIELIASKEEDVDIVLHLIFMNDNGSSRSPVRRIVTIERKDFSKDKIGTILRKLMFKW